MKAIRLGIIGLGYIGQIHLRHCLRLSNARVTAVSDLSKRALAQVRKTGVKRTYSDYHRLLKDTEIDAIIIALPTHLHLECARQTAEAGKHIFLEKPIARNIQEAREIMAAVERNGIRLMMGYPLRFNRKFCEIKHKIKEQSLGDIELAHAVYISSGPFFHRAEGYTPTPVPEWWFSKELTGGGVLMDLGSHLVNLLRWYFGEVTDVKAHFGHRFNMDFEDSATCLARFERGTTASINVGWFSQQYQLKVELFGSVKNAAVDHSPQNALVTAMQTLSRGIADFFWPHFAELQYFVDCLQKDVIPSPSAVDGLRDLEVITKAYENEVRLE